MIFVKEQIFKILLNKLYKLRHYIFHLEEIAPFIGIPLVYGIYFVYLIKWNLENRVLKLKTQFKYGKLDFNKICWVDPQKIQYYVSHHKYNKWNSKSRILNSDWDLAEKRFEDIGRVKAMEERFKEGKKWEEIEFYHYVVDLLSKGMIWGYKNKKDWDDNLKNIELLYENIKKNGYKSKNELYSYKKFYGKLVNLKLNKKVLDDVSLAISRDGHFLFVNGRHRLKIAQLLNIPKISSVIVLRHEKWMNFRKNIIDFSRKYQNGKLHYQLTHPDLKDIPFKYGPRCYSLIKENLSFSDGSLLEFGENLGYFCHKFEEDGFNCYTVAQSQIYLYFLKKLKKANQKKFNVIPKSIFEYEKNEDLKFEVVIFIDLFNCFIEGKNNHSNLIRLLKRLNIKDLFAIVPNPKTHRNRKWYRDFSLDQFINFIIENSCLKRAQYIGEIEERQLLYKFTINNVKLR